MANGTDRTTDVANEAANDFSSQLRRTLWGCLLITSIAIVWVMGTQFARDTYIPGKFEAPFLVLYIWTSWLLLFYPVYILARYIFSGGQSNPKEEFKFHVRLYFTEGDRYGGQYIGLSLLFSALWSAAHYTYIRGLDPIFLPPGEVGALYSTHHSFVYLLSWIVLFEKFVAVRILAMIFSISGIVLSTYAGGFGPSSMLGVILPVTASSAITVFKVLFKKFLGTPGYGQISFFTSLFGLGNVLCLWPIVLTLWLTDAEVVTPEYIPWGYIMGSSVLFSALHFLISYMEHSPYSTYTGFGFMIGIIMCTVVDYVWRGITYSGMTIAAVALTTFGVLLVLLPDQCPADCGSLSLRCQKWKGCGVRVNGTSHSSNESKIPRCQHNTSL